MDLANMSRQGVRSREVRQVRGKRVDVTKRAVLSRCERAQQLV
jgi:hypothetical protein